ncbi:hypothetical protein [Phycicoccus sonneratiae]|uniref:Uncharacterized protein n=1 Tax=Phycicoccus sonneratiae TaxID=2807628 RepID=A0ABS2CKH4_9MICO|nr:hypothetical protein [Phycicoccus sonneraticus]MBM6400384.1 hypothetical protein [Phycicoccus sonneraticus]
MDLLRALAAGAGGGLVWAVVARGFMRLLTTTPEFSWAGTLTILGAGTVAGALSGVVHAARVGGRSGWWRLALLPALLLFAGPGALLVPSVVGFALVLRGGRRARVVGAVLAAASPVLATLPDPGSVPTAPTPTQLAGLVVLTVATVPMGWALGEVTRRWRGAAATRPATTPVRALAGRTEGFASTG